MAITDILRQEHANIMESLQEIVDEIDDIRVTGRVNAERLSNLVELHNFVHNSHYSKELNCLYAILERKYELKGTTLPTSALLDEQGEGQHLMHMISVSLPSAICGERAAVETVLDSLLSYVSLMKSHVAREEASFSIFANSVLTEADGEAIARALASLKAKEDERRPFKFF